MATMMQQETEEARTNAATFLHVLDWLQGVAAAQKKEKSAVLKANVATALQEEAAKGLLRETRILNALRESHVAQIQAQLQQDKATP